MPTDPNSQVTHTSPQSVSSLDAAVEAGAAAPFGPEDGHWVKWEWIGSEQTSQILSSLGIARAVLQAALDAGEIVTAAHHSKLVDANLTAALRLEREVARLRQALTACVDHMERGDGIPDYVETVNAARAALGEVRP